MNHIIEGKGYLPFFGPICLYLLQFGSLIIAFSFKILWLGKGEDEAGVACLIEITIVRGGQTVGEGGPT